MTVMTASKNCQYVHHVFINKKTIEKKKGKKSCQFSGVCSNKLPSMCNMKMVDSLGFKKQQEHSTVHSPYVKLTSMP